MCHPATLCVGGAGSSGLPRLPTVSKLPTTTRTTHCLMLPPLPMPLPLPLSLGLDYPLPTAAPNPWTNQSGRIFDLERGEEPCLLRVHYLLAS